MGSSSRQEVERDSTNPRSPQSLLCKGDLSISTRNHALETHRSDCRDTWFTRATSHQEISVADPLSDADMYNDLQEVDMSQSDSEEEPSSRIAASRKKTSSVL